ncbi:MAG: metalloregulator ArsR/SmtB family transcription factor [Rickettsiales bacterium]|nr:metalloregulator ArsR/SmtB family transcription factor [Rickettsiales bacterium]
MRTKHALKALSALAQESRLTIFKTLVRSGKDGISAGELGEKLGIPPATLSFHLSQLSNAEMIQSQKQGRTIIYSANFENMKNLLEYLYDRFVDSEIAATPQNPEGDTKASG